MAKFPKIQRKCPVKNSLSEYMSNGVCNLCDREVHDIGQMSETERQNFLTSCSDEVCVKYTLARTTKVAAVALSSVLMTLPSAAQESSPLQDTVCPVSAGSNCGDAVITDDYEMVVIVGGIKDTSNIEYVDTEEDLSIPALPVTYDEG